MLLRHAMRDSARLITRFTSLIAFLVYFRLAEKALNFGLPVPPLAQDCAKRTVVGSPFSEYDCFLVRVHSFCPFLIDSFRNVFSLP